MTAVGKRVGGAVYLCREARDFLAECSQASVTAAEALAASPDWNVLKIAPRAVSFLTYENFDEVAFPALLAAVTVDLKRRAVTRTDYSSRKNPPILHRKELLLCADDPRRPIFAALTRAAEEHGLFHDTNRIGTREAWRARLEAAGLKVVAHKLVPIGTEAVDVARHKTAIVRRDLSQPMSLMLRWGVIDSNTQVFDYGCGQGDDVAALRANGYEAFGWDPHHAKDGLRAAADVVNLGFVLNVIEDPFERLETLRSAWSFAKRALTVSVMVLGKQSIAGLRPYKDGFLSSRGTFQRYFSQDELRDLVEEAIGERPLSMAPGIVSLFRDKDLEQEVAYRKRSRASFIADTFRTPDRPLRSGTVRPPLRERLAPELEEIWRTALRLGRAPERDELTPSVQEALTGARVSTDRAIAFAMRGAFDSALLQEAGRARREDLTVHFALSLFPGAPRYAHLARSIQRDVRAFFRSHAAALEAAQRLLYSVGQPTVIGEACKAAVQGGLGGFASEDVFRFRAGTLARLPPPLRVIAGCAEVLRDDLMDADFLDIPLGGGGVSAVYCDDGDRHFPTIRKIVDIDLKALRSRRRRESGGGVLYLKGRYLAADDPAREAQSTLDAKLLAYGFVNELGEGPTLAELSAKLSPSSGP